MSFLSNLPTFWRTLFIRPAMNIAGLDGLRAWAALLIIGYHCGLFSGLYLEQSVALDRLGLARQFWQGAWAGIDIFFVLSGFLIGRILIKNQLTLAQLLYPQFLIRRACRIFPAYYLVLVCTIFFLSQMQAYQFFVSGDLALLQERSWSNILYLSNYFYPGENPNWMSWGWSLCVEEHFYILLPPLLYIIFRAAPSRPGILLFCVALMPLGGRVLQYLLNPQIKQLQGFYYYSHNHFDELLYGVILAWFVLNQQNLFSQLSFLKSLALECLGLSLWAVIWSVGGLSANNAFTLIWQYPLLALGTICIMIPTLHQSGLFSRLLGLKLWIPLAKVSYGMYLLHPFMIFLTLNTYLQQGGDILTMSTQHYWLYYSSVLLLTWLAAAIMYLFWEQHFLTLGHRLTKKR